MLQGFSGLQQSLGDLGNWQRDRSIQRRLEQRVPRVEERARDKIGEYQPAVSTRFGHWDAWARLAEETEKRKARANSFDEPLLGVTDAEHMRDDIRGEYETTWLGAQITVGIPEGSRSSPYALVQEQGSFGATGRGAVIPARPFLRPALDQEGEEFAKEMDGVVREWVYRAGLRARRNEE